MRPHGPPQWPPFDDAVMEAVRQTLADGSWGKYRGPHCPRLEGRLAEEYGGREILLCGSGTAAVELALRGLKIGSGDEVVLAAYDFKANFQNVLIVGATPVLVDVSAENWNLDVASLDAAITAATKALIASHLHGGVVPMPAVMDLAQRRGIAVIEDACQAHGARVAGRPAGAWGDVGVLSFGGSKLITAGRGGAVITPHEDIAQRIRLYTQRGNEAYPLSELQAAVLLPQWEQLKQRHQQRRFAVAELAARLAPDCGIALFRNAELGSGEETQPAYYKVGLQYHPERYEGMSRDRFADAMRAEGIAVDAGFRGLHLTHSRRRFRSVGALPVAGDADRRVLTWHHPALLEGTSAVEEFLAALDKLRRFARILTDRE